MHFLKQRTLSSTGIILPCRDAVGITYTFDRALLFPECEAQYCFHKGAEIPFRVCLRILRGIPQVHAEAILGSAGTCFYSSLHYP